MLPPDESHQKAARLVEQAMQVWLAWTQSGFVLMHLLRLLFDLFCLFCACSLHLGLSLTHLLPTSGRIIGHHLLFSWLLA